MSDSDPYEQEFDSDSSSNPPPPKNRIRPPSSDHYSDEEFEDKSSDLPIVQKITTKQPQPRSIPAQISLKSTTFRRSNDDFSIKTGKKAFKKEYFSGEIGGNAQSTGQLLTVADFDTPEQAKKYLFTLKKENDALRERLKDINRKLDGILDVKISKSKT